VTRRRWIGVAIVAVAGLLLLGRLAAGAYAEFQWYASLDALAVWHLRMRTLLAMRSIAFVGWSAFFFLNFYAVRRSVAAVRIPRRMANLEIGEDLPGRYLDYAAGALALAVAALFAWSHTDWMRTTLAWNGLPFGEIAPPFELDLGFYVYWLPFETALRDTALVGLVIAIGLVLVLYAMTPSLRRAEGGLYISNYVRRHLVVLVALLLVVLAWTFRLDAHNALIDGSGAEGMFTAADRRGTIPANGTLSLLTLAVAALVLWTGWTGQLRIASTVVALLLVGAVAARQIAPRAAASTAAEAARTAADAAAAGADLSAAADRPYALMRAVYTRRAYGVDQLRPLGGDVRPIPGPDAASAMSAWDPSALTRAAARIAGGVPHRVGWSVRGTQLEAVIPVAPNGETGGSTAWEVLRFAAPLADAQGDVVSRGQDLRLTRSERLAPVRIVDGAQGYLLVPNAPDGIAGVSLDSRRSRVALAWAAQHYALLTQPAGTRVLRVRDPRELVRRLVPFFRQGSTLFPVVDRDSLYWVVELYATSNRYPLSRHFHLGGEEVRYAHHAATAIVNAATGRVQLVLDDIPEPLARSWTRLVPGMFESWAAVRPSLADALPPAIDGARLQAEALAAAGTRERPAPGGNLPPQEGAAPELLAGDPTVHGILVGDEARSATAWTVPVLDREQHVRGAIVAVGGRLHASRWFGLEGGERWPVIRESLRRALDTAAVVPRDARVVHGPVRAAALPEAVVLTQTAYLWRGEAPPSLLGTAAWTGRGPARSALTIPEALGIAIEPTLRDDGPLRGDALEARVRALYAAMQEALSRGDLAGFGAAFDSLGRALGRLPPP
jgi:uncharacterized protein